MYELDVIERVSGSVVLRLIINIPPELMGLMMGKMLFAPCVYPPPVPSENVLLVVVPTRLLVKSESSPTLYSTNWSFTTPM